MDECLRMMLRSMAFEFREVFLVTQLEDLNLSDYSVNRKES